MQDDCDLEEVEMTDPDAEPDVDIDSSDSNNPLAVVDYVEDIYTYYRQTEVKFLSAYFCCCFRQLCIHSCANQG